MSTPRKAIVTRDVPKEERHNYLHRDVKEGEVFYDFVGNTYGCISREGGVALSEKPGENPFFEFPKDAVKFEW